MSNSNEDLSKKTTWIGADLNSDKWTAFPTIKLDGEIESVVVRAKDYDVMFVDTQGDRSFGVRPQHGLFIFKKRVAPPTTAIGKEE